MAAFLPPPSVVIDSVTFVESGSSRQEHTEDRYVGLGIGGGPHNEFEVYIGPKDVVTMERVNPKLGAIVNRGYRVTLALGLAAIAFLIAALRARARAQCGQLRSDSKKERHGCFTIWLAAIIMSSLAGVLIWLISFKSSGSSQDMLSLIWSFGALIFAIALLKWKKWGFFGYCIGCTVFGISHYFLDPRRALRYGVLPVTVSAITLSAAVLYYVLQIGNQRRGWGQLE